MTGKDIMKAVLKSFGIALLVVAGIMLLIVIAILVETMLANCGFNKEASCLLTLIAVLFIMLFIGALGIEIQSMKYNKPKDKDGKR